VKSVENTTKKGKLRKQFPFFKNRQKVGKRKFPDFDSNTHNHLKIILNGQLPYPIVSIFMIQNNRKT
jgi:hypothetical protein